jgi:hypothetical protein
MEDHIVTIAWRAHVPPSLDAYAAGFVVNVEVRI